MALIIVGVVLVIIILWFISAQRKLVAMDENINNAMGQDRCSVVLTLGCVNGTVGSDKRVC